MLMHGRTASKECCCKNKMKEFGSQFPTCHVRCQKRREDKAKLNRDASPARRCVKDPVITFLANQLVVRKIINRWCFFWRNTHMKNFTTNAKIHDATDAIWHMRIESCSRPRNAHVRHVVKAEPIESNKIESNKRSMLKTKRCHLFLKALSAPS